MNKISSIYITFNRTEGYEEAMKVSNNKDFDILIPHNCEPKKTCFSQAKRYLLCRREKETAKFKPAPSPRDVKWENKHENQIEIARTLKQTVFLLVFIFFVYFFGVGDLARKSLESQIHFFS